MHDKPTRGFRNKEVKEREAEGTRGRDDVVEALPRPEEVEHRTEQEDGDGEVHQRSNIFAILLRIE